MRKMILRLIVVMSLLVVSIAYQANASPPDIGNDYTYEVVTPDVDNFVFTQVAPDVDVFVYSAPDMATEESFYVEVHIDAMVREVTACRKISILKPKSGSVAENTALAFNSACSNYNYYTKSPPLLQLANVANINYLVRNLQHNNFGYPLSAN